MLMTTLSDCRSAVGWSLDPDEAGTFAIALLTERENTEYRGDRLPKSTP